MAVTSEHNAPLTVVAEAQARLQHWRRDHPRATLREIEAEVDRHLAQVRTHLLTQVAHQGPATVRPDCPTCGAAMQRVGRRERTVHTVHDETLTLRGDGYRCPACGAGLFPPG